MKLFLAFAFALLCGCSGEVSDSQEPTHASGQKAAGACADAWSGQCDGADATILDCGDGVLRLRFVDYGESFLCEPVNSTFDCTGAFDDILTKCGIDS